LIETGLVDTSDVRGECLSVIAFVAVTSVPCIYSSAGDSTLVGKTTYIFCLAEDCNSPC